MIDHMGIGVADIGRAAAFYDAALGTLGLRRLKQIPDGSGADGIGYAARYPVWIVRFHSHGLRQHTAFAARSRRKVEAFHTAAVKRVEPTTERRAFIALRAAPRAVIGAAATLHLSSVPTATMSMPSSGRTSRRGAPGIVQRASG